VVEEPTCDPQLDFSDISGRRVVDLSYFLNQIWKIGDHGREFRCTLSNVRFKNEKLYGLKSKIKFKCNMCNLEFSVQTCNDKSETMDVNTASVAGAMAIGIGHSQVKELFSSLEIPTMSYNTYSKYHDKVSDGWEKAALQEMEAAAKEEAEYAVASGRVTPDGVPMLTVVADGCWAKRSYRTNYTSLSGVVSEKSCNKTLKH